MSRMVNKETFVQKALEVHGDRYNYHKVVYEKSDIKVEIECRIHGTFLQTPNKHTQKRGCPKCAIKRSKILQRKTKNSFMVDLENVWGVDFYLTDKIVYNGCFNKIELGCKEEGHGYFFITPDALLRGHGCPICGKIKNLYNLLSKDKLTNVEMAKSVDAYIYLMLFNNFFKIGVSTNLKTRVRQAKCELMEAPKEVKVIKSNLFEAFTIESVILKNYSNFSVKNDIDDNVSGKTEFLSLNCLNVVLSEYNWFTLN